MLSDHNYRMQYALLSLITCATSISLLEIKNVVIYFCYSYENQTLGNSLFIAVVHQETKC